MEDGAFSPRRPPSLQRHKQRPPAACVDVQWTFLPPQSSRLYSDAMTPSVSNARLVDRFDNAQARTALQAEQLRLRATKDAAEAHDQRVLYDLMGETQRQALLDKTMAAMEAMALSPTKTQTTHRRHHHRQTTEQQPQHSPSPPATVRRSSGFLTSGSQSNVELLPQRRLSALGTEPPDLGDLQDSEDADGSEDSDEEDPEDDSSSERGAAADDIPELRAIRDRHQHRKRVEVSSRLDQGTQIRWQNSSHVCVALDLPTALLHDTQENHSITIGREEHSLMGLLSLAEDAAREKKARSPLKSPTHKEVPLGVIHPPLDFATSPRALRVKKASYGSWYVPRDEWWSLHHTQQETLVELFPKEQPPPVERHTCQRESRNQRHTGKESMQPQPIHPPAWPSLLRSPSPTSLVRTPTTRSRSPPRTAARSVQTARASFFSSFFTEAAPPPTASGALPSGRGLPSREVSRQDGVSTPTKKASSTAVAPDAIAQRAAELQQEISQSYIAREYRDYLAASGKRVPAYLNN